ncbi:MAG TPA: HEPN domain-containing protein [bacterium]|nr:HEPN domain-containing protein [bacterium]
MREMPEERGRYWLKEAESNMSLARLVAEREYYSFACFHAQQAAEMALKAFLAFRGEVDMRTHSLHRLLAVVGRYDDEASRLDESGRALEEYYTATRYPNGIGTGAPSDYFNERQSREALAAAGEVLGFVKERI